MTLTLLPQIPGTRILNNVENIAKSQYLHLEPTTYKSLSISVGYSKVVQFNQSELNISSILDFPERCLGSHIAFSGKQNEISECVNQRLTTTLENINNSMVRDEYNLKV